MIAASSTRGSFLLIITFSEHLCFGVLVARKMATKSQKYEIPQSCHI
jgi:hypothetical protein